MDHLAQDLTVALEQSESCGPITFTFENGSGKWGMRRRTRSAGNLNFYNTNNSGDNHSEESSSSTSDLRIRRNKFLSMKHPLHTFLRGRCSRLGVNHSLESDSVNENSPARPYLRRKRKLKRMSFDETPVPPNGKRKRPQQQQQPNSDSNGRHNTTTTGIRHQGRIKPLHQSLVDKIEKFCQPNLLINDDPNKMETQSVDDCDFASESSISWSGGEGHDGDDELTDWAPSMDGTSITDQSSWNDTDPREIRAGCRRLGDERPGFSISTGANERVAKFLQDPTKTELRVLGGDREKLGQLAALYSLDLWFDGTSSSLLRKTSKTPCMQPTQRHHSGYSAAHKRIRTQDHIIS